MFLQGFSIFVQKIFYFFILFSLVRTYLKIKKTNIKCKVIVRIRARKLEFIMPVVITRLIIKHVIDVIITQYLKGICPLSFTEISIFMVCSIR